RTGSYSSSAHGDPETLEFLKRWLKTDELVEHSLLGADFMCATCPASRLLGFAGSEMELGGHSCQDCLFGGVQLEVRVENREKPSSGLTDLSLTQRVLSKAAAPD